MPEGFVVSCCAGGHGEALHFELDVELDAGAEGGGWACAGEGWWWGVCFSMRGGGRGEGGGDAVFGCVVRFLWWGRRGKGNVVEGWGKGFGYVPM